MLAPARASSCDTVGMVAQGRRPSPITQANEEETEKRLAGLLMRGDGTICIDNCTQPVAGDKLNSILTQETANLRPLGGSRVVECSTNTLVLINGNNLSLIGDMNRRVVMCQLDAQTEHPEMRAFDFNPVDRIQADRGRYVMACLTILLAYREAGMPKAQAKPVGSYETWARWVRDALLWVGEADPAVTILDNKKSDQVAERIRAVFHHWADVIGEGVPVTVKAIIDAAQRAIIPSSAKEPSKPELRDALHAVAAPFVRGGASMDIDGNRLGQWLKKHKGTIRDGWKIGTVEELLDGNRQWVLERVKP